MEKKKNLGGLLGGLLSLSMLAGGGGLRDGMFGIPGMDDDDTPEELKGKTFLELIEANKKIMAEGEQKLSKDKEQLEKMREHQKKLKEALDKMSSEEKASQPAAMEAYSLLLEYAEFLLPDLEKGLEEAVKQHTKQKQHFEMAEPMMREAAEKAERREKEMEELRKEEEDLMKKALFKPGDKARVSKNPIRPDDEPFFNDEMALFKGKVVTIGGVSDMFDNEVTYYIEEDYYNWAERWLEPVDKKQPKKLPAPKKSS